MNSSFWNARYWWFFNCYIWNVLLMNSGDEGSSFLSGATGQKYGSKEKLYMSFNFIGARIFL